MSESDLFETFTYLAKELKRQYPKMAYLHAVTPRIAGNTDIECPENESLDFLVRHDFINVQNQADWIQHKIWSEQPFILAGSYNPETAKKEVAQHKNVLIGFGRHFISNVSQASIGIVKTDNVNSPIYQDVLGKALNLPSTTEILFTSKGNTLKGISITPSLNNYIS